MAVLAGCVVEDHSTSVGASIQTISIKVCKQDWEYSSMKDNNYFYAGMNIPEITSAVFNNGEVRAYLVYDRYNTNLARKHALPYVLHKEELNTLGQMVLYTETVDFTYGKGWVEFNFCTSDFIYEYTHNPHEFNPGDMEFDIVITLP